ncbi:hypothetical protein [Candidatus Cardinium hertigii]|nr:hypothetical protein [Candidatus Cardinium hertigii]
MQKVTKRWLSYLIFFILLGQPFLLVFPCISHISHPLSFYDYIEQIYQRQNFTEEEDFESIKEALQEAYATPLDLNQVSKEALAALGILSKNQLNNYFNHIATTGPLYSKYELQAIPDFDLTTIALLLPFIFVLESYSIPSDSIWERIAKSETNYFLFRYAPAFNANISKKHLGNLDQCTTQLSLQNNNDLALGITARKQAGEAFCWDHAKHLYGFNLWSVFLAIESKKYFKRVIIGDYQVGYGQGLLLSAGYSMEKGADITSIIRSNNMGICPYKSIRRIGLRGIAITSALGPFELTGFYATHNLDAKIEEEQGNIRYTHSIDQIGKYDTIHNLNKKGTVNEQVIGCTLLTHGNKNQNKNQNEVGIILLYNHYDTPIIPKESIFSDHLFYGQRAVATSLFYRLLWKNVLLFGEGGITFPDATIANKHNEKALIIGSIISLSSYLDLTSALYYYGEGFYSPYENAFKRYTTDNANERGFYGGVKLTPLARWQISTSGHFFSTLRPRTQLATAGYGHIFTTRSSYALNRETILLIQHRFNKTPKDKLKKGQDTIAIGEEEISAAYKNSIKLKIDRKLSHYWWTNIETQYTHHNFLEHTHHGYALANTQKWKSSIFQFSCKIIYFNVQDYAARLYFYKPAPLYHGTRFQAYCGNGIAVNGLVCWKPIRFIRLELQYIFMHLFNALPLTMQKKMTKKKHPNVSTANKHAGTIQFILNF